MEAELRVLLLGPREKKGGLRFSEKGFHAVHIPVVVVEERREGVWETRRMLESWNTGVVHLAFTSSIGAGIIAERLGSLVKKMLSGGRLVTACIGPSTARELEERNIPCMLIPETYTGVGLGETLCRRRAERIVMPRSDKGLQGIIRVLEECGARVADIPVYSIRPDWNGAARAASLIGEGRVDRIIVSSPLIAEILVEAMGRRGLEPSMICDIAVAIGPTTASRLAELLGCRVPYPSKYTLDGAAEVLLGGWRQ